MPYFALIIIFYHVKIACYQFSLAMKKWGYSQSNGDHSLFYKHSNMEKITILIVYIDDIIITGDDSEE